jgi:chromosome segregation ATPase
MPKIRIFVKEHLSTYQNRGPKPLKGGRISVNAYTLPSWLLWWAHLDLSASISSSIAKCREQVRNLLTEFIVPSRTLEKMGAKELLEKTAPRVEEVVSHLKEIESSVLLIKPEAAPTLLKSSASVERRFNSYLELLRQDSIDPAENTRLGLEQLRQAVADVSEFLSYAEDAARSPNGTISYILDIVEKSKVDLSANIRELEAELQMVRQESEYLKRRLEETEYVVSTLRSEKASLENNLNQLSAQLQAVEEEAKKWKQEALSNSIKNVEELFAQLRSQVESLRSENERLRLMVRLERARYFTINQQKQKEQTGS